MGMAWSGFNRQHMENTTIKVNCFHCRDPNIPERLNETWSHDKFKIWLDNNCVGHAYCDWDSMYEDEYSRMTLNVFFTDEDDKKKFDDTFLNIDEPEWIHISFPSTARLRDIENWLFESFKEDDDNCWCFYDRSEDAYEYAFTNKKIAMAAKLKWG